MPTVTLLVSMLAVLSVDQATKVLVLATLHDAHGVSIGRLALRRVINRRAGLWQVRDRGAMLALWLIELVLLVAIVELVPAFHHWATQMALGAALGGAAGNLLDRWYRDGVIDFIDVGFWPVFNLADAAIVIGALGAASALV
jgi:signal peptidase II